MPRGVSTGTWKFRRQLHCPEEPGDILDKNQGSAILETATTQAMGYAPVKPWIGEGDTMIDQPDRQYSPEHRTRLISALEDMASERGLEVDLSFSEALLNYSEYVGVRELSNTDLGLVLGVIGALAIERFEVMDRLLGPRIFAIDVQDLITSICKDPFSTCKSATKIILDDQTRWRRTGRRIFPRLDEFAS